MKFRPRKRIRWMGNCKIRTGNPTPIWRRSTLIVHRVLMRRTMKETDACPYIKGGLYLSVPENFYVCHIAELFIIYHPISSSFYDCISNQTINTSPSQNSICMAHHPGPMTSECPGCHLISPQSYKSDHATTSSHQHRPNTALRLRYPPLPIPLN